MQLSTSQAAQELGVSARQVRRAVINGSAQATRHGNAHSLSSRQVQVMTRTTHRGRNWSDKAVLAALDLLASGSTSILSGSERSRLKQRIRSTPVGALAGQILRGKVSLRRAVNTTSKRNFAPTMLRELQLSRQGGLGVLIAQNADRVARDAHLARDDSGDIVIVEGTEKHKGVLEALALYAFGDTRECSAAEAWIAGVKERI